jgi:hypothetical protein
VHRKPSFLTIQHKPGHVRNTQICFSIFHYASDGPLVQLETRRVLSWVGEVFIFVVQNMTESFVVAKNGWLVAKPQ